MSDLRLEAVAHTDTDPRSRETVDELDPVIDRYIGLADGHPELQARGEELRRRLHEVGFLVATSVFAMGRRLCGAAGVGSADHQTAAPVVRGDAAPPGQHPGYWVAARGAAPVRAGSGRSGSPPAPDHEDC